MKRISFFLAAALFAMPAMMRAQDAAVEERLNKLSAQLDDLFAAQQSQRKRTDELAKAVRDLQDQQSKPPVNYATQEDLKQLTEKLQEIDRKRQHDNELLVKSIEDIRKAVGGWARSPAIDSSPLTASDKPHYEKIIESGDTLNAIVAAYREKGIKVTLEQIVNANPGLDPKKLKVGQKIVIPAPQQ